jgi:hypothetical protein
MCSHFVGTDVEPVHTPYKAPVFAYTRKNQVLVASISIYASET